MPENVILLDDDRLIAGNALVVSCAAAVKCNMAGSRPAANKILRNMAELVTFIGVDV